MFEKCYESRTINEEIFMIYLMTSQLRQYICIVHENEKKIRNLSSFPSSFPLWNHCAQQRNKTIN